MTLGFSPANARGVLDSTVTAYPYIQLHTGDPGVAGTANPATNTSRKNPAFAAASTSGATTTKTTTADAVWPSVPGSEDYSHFSLWSAPTGGSFGGSGLVTANPVVVGDTFQFPAGAFTLSMGNAA